jgi:hypothetical protein
MPPKFDFPENNAIWLPLQLDPLTIKRGEGQWVRTIARLKPGVTYDAASADVDAIARRLAKEYKETNDGIGAQAKPFVDGDMGKEPRQLLYTMLGAVGLVLLIACANVANLLLDRAAHRTKEVGIRTALGASRLTVVRQFLTEALLLSAAAALLGLAHWVAYDFAIGHWAGDVSLLQAVFNVTVATLLLVRRAAPTARRAT